LVQASCFCVSCSCSSLLKYFNLFVVLALAFVPLGDNGIHIRAVKLELNVYTAPGFLGAVLALLNIVLVVLYFKDYNINFDTGDVGSRASSIQHSDSTVPDKRAVIGCIGLFFVVFLVFTVFETYVFLAMFYYIMND
jgi:hypothetical protein